MDIKEKVVPKEEMKTLIEEHRFSEFFEAIDSSEWKYDKAVYLRLKENFMRGLYGIDFANRLSVFVSTLEDKPRNDDLIENDKLDIKDILGKIKKLKFSISLIDILDLFFFLCNMLGYISVLFTASSAFFLRTNLISFASPTFILLAAVNIIVLMCAILPPIIIKYSSGIYQFLVPIAALQSYNTNTEEFKVIEKAQDAVISFAVSKGNINERRVKYLLVMILFLLSKSIVEDNSTRIKNQPTIQTYIYSPSFDSLLQNDKKIYQYVDSLVQKHKK